MYREEPDGTRYSWATTLTVFIDPRRRLSTFWVNWRRPPDSTKTYAAVAPDPAAGWKEMVFSCLPT